MIALRIALLVTSVAALWILYIGQNQAPGDDYEAASGFVRKLMTSLGEKQCNGMEVRYEISRERFLINVHKQHSQPNRACVEAVVEALCRTQEICRQKKLEIRYF